MKSILTLGLLLFFGYNAIGQQAGSLEGRVTDMKGNPLPGVSLALEGTRYGTLSDSEGYYSLSLPASGKYVLIASLIGYETFSRHFEVTGSAQPISVQLRETMFQLPEVVIARETMTGASTVLKDIPGAAHYIGSRELEKFNYSDVNRILRSIPGVNLQEEEGFGLRPNIGMRGTGVERSSKITLMEDGILAASAPYVAPAAYYFPTVGRMAGIEVVKGSSQIRYGPYTTGGAINFLSTPIPDDFSAKISLQGGNLGRRTAHASVGQSFTYGGVLLESYHISSTGFKDLDNGGPTGFNNRDYLAKVRINTRRGAKVFQSLTFKAGQSTGAANETYLGLTEDDFHRTPFRRYAASQLDKIETDQRQLSLKYNIVPARHVDVSVTAYHNKFKRNWYKLDNVKYGTRTAVGIASLVEEPSLYPDEYALLTGTSSPNADGLFMKNNNRRYAVQGIQSIIGLNFASESVSHDIEIGFRYHEDEEDRYQWVDSYRMQDGAMSLTERGVPGSESNRISTARASAAYFQYSLKYQGRLHLLPGLRYERIRIERDDFGKNDPDRTGVALAEASNEVEIWIPGIGVAYDVTDDLQTFAGVHRGFAPPGAKEGTKPERSINYELGARASHSDLQVHTVLFFSDYQNLLGSDLAAAGGGGTGDPFNAGQAVVYGSEAEITYRLRPADRSGIEIPLTLIYTYTDGIFKSAFSADHEDWGNVEDGDHLPYLVTHQLGVNMSVEHRKFDVHVSGRYVGSMRTAPGHDNIPAKDRINSNFIMDISASARVSREITAFCSINNLLDDVYVVARRPAGLRPGLPRTFQAGLRASW